MFPLVRKQIHSQGNILKNGIHIPRWEQKQEAGKSLSEAGGHLSPCDMAFDIVTHPCGGTFSLVNHTDPQLFIRARE